MATGLRPTFCHLNVNAQTCTGVQALAEGGVSLLLRSILLPPTRVRVGAPHALLLPALQPRIGKGAIPDHLACLSAGSRSPPVSLCVLGGPAGPPHPTPHLQQTEQHRTPGGGGLQPAALCSCVAGRVLLVVQAVKACPAPPESQGLLLVGALERWTGPVPWLWTSCSSPACSRARQKNVVFVQNVGEGPASCGAPWLVSLSDAAFCVG